jgi:murein DD-endopeptidase MepM/ murein hydrolase activator NlpD
MYRHSRPLTLFAASFLASAILLLATPALGAPPLRAPWACGESYQVSQSHQTGSHVGKGTWSWDFAMPVGTQVIAPAEGTVRAVRQDSTRYGCDSSYAYDANYVILSFQDGTEALFLHLEANSVPVSVGDRVRAGDVIGNIGMSGWTCGPHLHFQVQQTCDSWWCSSVPASFAQWGDPSTGQKITSANCTRPSDEPQMASYTPEDPEDATGGQAPACYAP